MGCNCRAGLRSLTKAPARSVTPPGIRPSLCTRLEGEGNLLTVRVGNSGRLYLGVPYASEIPAASLLPSIGCRGSFAQAVLAAESKLVEIYLSPSKKARFLSSIPGENVKLGFLREILLGF